MLQYLQNTKPNQKAPDRTTSTQIPQYRVYTHVLDCENELLKSSMQVQTSDDEEAQADYTAEDEYQYGTKGNNYHFAWGTFLADKMLAKKIKETNPSWFFKIIEDVILLITGIINAPDYNACVRELIIFLKLQHPNDCFALGIPLENAMKFFGNLWDEMSFQADETFFSQCRSWLSNYEELKNAPIFKKLYRLAMYLLSSSIFEKMGLTFDTLRYSKIEAEALKRKYHMGIDFVHCLLDTTLFVCERGWQCMKTGSMDPIYHSGSTYEKWYDEAMGMKKRFRGLQSNANPHERFEILADLRSLIEKGQAIKKHATRIGKQEVKLVAGVVSDLEMLLAEETTKRAAQQERKAPFSVLLYGGSSIGKSTITKMLYYQYGKVFGLPLGSEFKFTRNANANFWDGFNSSQWCVQLDDIAYMRPSKAANGDPTIMEMLQVVNNVPFVPDQADIADKGRTPMRAELVIATTNCETLNAFHYFQTPLAVQRRLPFVIDARPKPEYLRDGCMLDSNATELLDGEWPDYWIFTVKKVVPVGIERMGQQGTLEEIAEYDDVNEFLAWFSRAAKEHAHIQTLVDDCDINMSKISICDICYKTPTKCSCIVDVEPQSVDTYFGPVSKTRSDYYLAMVQYAIAMFFMKFATTPFLGPAFRTIIGTETVQNHFFTNVIPDPVMRQVCRMRMKWMGDCVNAKMSAPKILATCCATLVTALAVKKAFDFASLYTKKEPTTTPQYEETKRSEGQCPSPREDEKQNVWYNDSFELSTFDVSSKTLSWKELDLTKVKSLLARNCVYFESYHPNGKQVRRVRSFGVRGHIFVTNNHGLYEFPTFRMKLVTGHNAQGVNGNLEMTVSQSDIHRIPEMDLAFFRIRNLPPVKDIVDLFPINTISGVLKGQYIARNVDGSMYERSVSNIRSLPETQAHAITLPSSLWNGFVDIPTDNGDCGAMLIANTYYGPTILGYHVLGGGNQIKAIPITRDDILTGLNHFDEPHIECSQPRLDVPGYEKHLIELHPKSVVRYVEDGSADVHGSFDGFKQAPKSHVKPTLICEALQSLGIEVKHTKPQMSGYAPWRTAILDMVKPVMDIDTSILKECVESYTQDILGGLTEQDLAEIMVYDTKTAVNGAAGVQYVDKMNRNTSAGFPFGKSKRHFLNAIPGNLGEELVEPTEEIVSELEYILERYSTGQRASPVFAAHLKDEAVTFKKALIGKTRVFTGAPFAWSIANRKYLLSVTRVLQRNRYVWEGMPGMNAMSKEWDVLYRHLTKFGRGRIVAGDYAAFDKTMPPCIILAAFDVLRKICKAAGYTASDLGFIQGIAEDTAFPIVDFNGDLFMFYGSNPSGHPLTVIINGIANSLYMRMCYWILNPEHETLTFQEFVALATYGDDNIMGVSEKIPWFNHTSIQATLAGLGIRYTMADKEAPSVPYIDIADASFLKRSFRFESDVGMMVCPLEKESIYKMLTIGVVSKTLCREAQSVENIKTAMREAFFHGKEYFHELQDILLQAVKLCDLDIYTDENTFPTWEFFTSGWIEATLLA